MDIKNIIYGNNYFPYLKIFIKVINNLCMTKKNNDEWIKIKLFLYKYWFDLESAGSSRFISYSKYFHLKN